MAKNLNILSWMTGRLFVLVKLTVLITIIGLFVFYSKKYFQIAGEIDKANDIAENHKKQVEVDIFKEESLRLFKKFPKFVRLKEDPVDGEQNKAVIQANEVSSDNMELTINKKQTPCYNVHTFYYPWYGNPSFDKTYLHWNHAYLPHWNPEIAKIYQSGSHQPPDDIGSDFYPELGPYSSHDPSVIENHMAQLSFSGIGVIIVSYYPPGLADDNGRDWQDIFPLLLEAAEKYKIKVGFHIEPYKNRDASTVKTDIKFIIDTYSLYPAFYNHTHNKKTLPLIYIYDSYHTKPKAWATILKPNHPDSIRGTSYDAFIIGLYVKQQDGNDLRSGGFDGFYTYFAADGFTYGSTRRNWRKLKSYASSNDMLFIPSVGPGYIDTRIRPWNKENTRKRVNGRYYEESWTEALGMNTEIISVTSFNEWHEGTQIEKAVSHRFIDHQYENYLPHGSDYYLKITKKFVEKYSRCKVSR